MLHASFPWELFLHVLLAYMDCWKSICVGNVVFFEGSYVYMQRINTCLLLLLYTYVYISIYIYIYIYFFFFFLIMSRRCEKYEILICFHHFCFFNVALQDLGSRDPKYVLFVGVFDCCVSTQWVVLLFVLALFVILHYRIHCFLFCFFMFEFRYVCYWNTYHFIATFEFTVQYYVYRRKS